MAEPVTSEGMRSGVNWIRLKFSVSVCANERAIRVLARPGKSSIRTWPSARMPSSTSSRASRFPTTARSTSSRTVPATRSTSDRVRAPDSGLDRIELVDDAAQTCQVDAPGRPVLGRLTVRPNQLPGFRPDQAACAGRLGPQVHAPRGQTVGRDPDQVRTQPEVEVERGAQREVDGVLQLLELPQPLGRRAASPRPRQPEPVWF